MKKKTLWLIMSAIFVIGFVIVIVNIPRVLGRVFENSAYLLRNTMIKEAPPEYKMRIERDFDTFILAFKDKKVKQDDLAKLSELIKSANEDGKLDQVEINELLELIETITPGLK